LTFAVILLLNVHTQELFRMNEIILGTAQRQNKSVVGKFFGQVGKIAAMNMKTTSNWLEKLIFCH
jgi:hypothetical protein